MVNFTLACSREIYPSRYLSWIYLELRSWLIRKLIIFLIAHWISGTTDSLYRLIWLAWFRDTFKRSCNERRINWLLKKWENQRTKRNNLGFINSKASRKSSSGYSNHSFAHQHEEDDYSIYQQLNHRSASMVRSSRCLSIRLTCIDRPPSGLPVGCFRKLPSNCFFLLGGVCFGWICSRNVISW